MQGGRWRANILCGLSSCWERKIWFDFFFFFTSTQCKVQVCAGCLACFSLCTLNWLLLMQFSLMFRRKKKCFGMLREFKRRRRSLVWGSLSFKKRKKKEDVTPRAATALLGVWPSYRRWAHCLNTHCPWFLSISAWNIHLNKAFLTFFVFFYTKKSALKFTLMFSSFSPWPEGCCRFLLSSLSCTGWHRV